MRRDLPQREPAAPILADQSDYTFLGRILHELAAGIVEAKSELARMLVPVAVLRDTESVHGRHRHAVTHLGQAGYIESRPPRRYIAQWVLGPMGIPPRAFGDCRHVVFWLMV